MSKTKIRRTDKQTDASVVSGKRNYGIDLLRIISMIMVPALHVLGHGGILDNADKMSMKYELAWLLEISCYCAVNVYALISGYVGYGRKTKYSNLIYLFFQVCFYIVCTTVIFKTAHPELVGKEELKDVFHPLTRSVYWYFTAYFCLFFIMPYLNILLETLNRKQTERLLVTLFIVFSFLPTVFYSDFGKMSGGYSFLWLAILYLGGAYFKKYDVKMPYDNIINYLLYILFAVVTWFSKVIGDVITIKFDVKPLGRGIFISYTSPTIVLCAVFLLLFFANIKCKKGTIAFVKFFAPVSFGVYLLHEEPLIRDNLIEGKFTVFLGLHPILMLSAVLGTALIIWLIGSLADRVRLLIFDLLHIKKLCEQIEKALRELFGKIENKIDKRHKNGIC